MKKTYYIWSIWFLLVVLWNFGFPEVHPIWDVVVAVLLSFLSKKIGDMWK